VKVEAIIPTAGLGIRLSRKRPKPLIVIDGEPLFVHTLKVFEKAYCVDSVILVVHSRYRTSYEKYVKKYRLSKVKIVMVGGETRQESVKRAIEYLDKKTRMVLIHDGVRPFISLKLIQKAVDLCKKHRAVVVAVPVKQTIKRVDDQGFVEATLKRHKLWEVQTPQVFRRDILEKAYRGNQMSLVTDDASLVENIGIKVKVAEGDYANIKITTPEDLMMAQMFLKQHKKKIS